ncbi:sulfotransferase [Aestuariicoccus sp. MJ-SS9]|uniref:sulfotransferase family protein n=1 Tax=Aestuariicoccus sp. MJ-SS9 TaxID=3079855 RepID=UPI0029129BA9|nr:sulfotransferase [Aestuariicoccus sp. MJ-SS9]MDU8913520.1 sulfotransferase [Aestuariicoccus sp. MJ-SS9]
MPKYKNKNLSTDQIAFGGPVCTIPDFFIIGAPKCGTTTLYEWLSSHPECFMPTKEPGFFSQDIRSTRGSPTHIPDLTSYCGIFVDCPANTKAIGEATPRYLYSDMALDAIKRLRPDARVIVCLRDPVDLAISFHNQKIIEGQESEIDFVSAWKRSCDRTHGDISTLAPSIDGNLNYGFWASYGRRLELLFERFPLSQIKIITLESLKNRPNEIWTELQDFLSLSQHALDKKEAYNLKKKVRWKHLHIFTRSLRKAILPLLHPIIKMRGGRGFGVLRMIDNLNLEPGNYTSEVPWEFRKGMYKALADDIHRAETLLEPVRLVTDPEIRASVLDRSSVMSNEVN